MIHPKNKVQGHKDDKLYFADSAVAVNQKPVRLMPEELC